MDHRGHDPSFRGWAVRTRATARLALTRARPRGERAAGGLTARCLCLDIRDDPASKRTDECRHNLIRCGCPIVDHTRGAVTTMWGLAHSGSHDRRDGGNLMKNKAVGIGGGIGIAALVGVILLYAAHPVRGSDHQDSPTTVNRPGADITDVFAYQAPDNPNNIVLQMDVWPLITHGALGM